jgi:hypothetical protein
MLLTSGIQFLLGILVLCFLVSSFFLCRFFSNGFEIIQFRTRTSALVSEQNCLGPATNRLNFPESSAEPLSLSRKEVETLFAPLFDDTIENRLSEVSPISVAHLDHHQEPDSPQQTTTTVGRDGPPIASPTTTEQTGSNSRQSAGDSIPKSVPQTAEHDPEAFFNPFAPA